MASGIRQCRGTEGMVGSGVFESLRVGNLVRDRAGGNGDGYTAALFHVPRLKRIALTTASVENETVMAMNTPFGPSSNGKASVHASGISQSQKQKKLRIVGVHTAPAPLNAAVSTMP